MDTKVSFSLVAKIPTMQQNIKLVRNKINIMIETITLVGITFAIFCIYWMLQMLKLTKQSRIISSMTLKVILKYCKNKGVEIDINKIQEEVEDNI